MLRMMFTERSCPENYKTLDPKINKSYACIKKKLESFIDISNGHLISGLKRQMGFYHMA